MSVNISQSFFGTPPIITNGLALYLDAGNLVSYPQGGSIWSDLSGNANNATLFNSPTFTSVGNIGNFTFNGTSQYCTSVSQPITNNSSFTIAAWIYLPTLPNNYSVIIDGGNIGVGNIGYGLGLDTSNRVFIAANTGYYNGPAISSSKWYFITATATYGSPYVFNMYYNGVLQANAGAASTSSLSNISSSVYIAKGTSVSFPYYFKGIFSQALIYNRALTAQEVLQNYNALKGRFGLN